MQALPDPHVGSVMHAAPEAEAQDTHLSAKLEGHNWVVFSMQDEQGTRDVLHTVERKKLDGDQEEGGATWNSHLGQGFGFRVLNRLSSDGFLFTTELKDNFLVVLYQHLFQLGDRYQSNLGIDSFPEIWPLHIF
jgi:hypothetical protein